MLKWERDAVEECVRALSAVPCVDNVQDTAALQGFARRMQVARSYVTATLSALINNDEETVRWGLANLRAHVLNTPGNDDQTASGPAGQVRERRRYGS